MSTPSYGGATDENPYADLNVIANPSFTLSAGEVDAAEITPALLADTLQEADAIEANVATGYHAIEFLLWGQDLNGTEAGRRQPAVDRLRRRATAAPAATATGGRPT